MENTRLLIDPFENPLDQLLAEIAFNIQLPPSHFKKAEERYEAVRKYIEKSDLFKDQVQYFYPQGSMAIDSTISTKGTDDEYDLDIIVQLGEKFRQMQPLEILKVLENVLKDYQGLSVVRQSRCVTVNYKDGMHLDFSPSIRELGTPERQGHICHAKGPKNSVEDHMVPMNAKGFESWYRLQTPDEENITNWFAKNWSDQGSLRAESEVDDVPDQAPFVVKNTATIALQLHKRYRNIQYADLSGRMPPSVLLSYFAGKAAKPKTTLTNLVIHMAKLMIREIEDASLYRRRINVSNPIYDRDVFTDRWPETLDQQNLYKVKLTELVKGLVKIQKIQNSNLSIMDMRDWLSTMFGDMVVTKSVERMASQKGNSIRESTQLYRQNTKLIYPIGAAASIPKNTVAKGRPHTFYGVKII